MRCHSSRPIGIIAVATALAVREAGGPTIDASKNSAIATFKQGKVPFVRCINV
jgi:hypothetical protein